MTVICKRCHVQERPGAAYCARCGLPSAIPKDKAGWTARDNRRGARIAFSLLALAVLMTVAGVKMAPPLALVGVVAILPCLLFATACTMAAKALEQKATQKTLRG